MWALWLRKIFPAFYMIYYNITIPKQFFWCRSYTSVNFIFQCFVVLKNWSASTDFPSLCENKIIQHYSTTIIPLSAIKHSTFIHQYLARLQFDSLAILQSHYFFFFQWNSAYILTKLSNDWFVKFISKLLI